MIYQRTITNYRSSKDNARVWTYSKIFLPLIFIATLASAFYASTLPNLISVILSIILVGILIKLSSRRYKITFVEIDNGTLSYFDAGKGEMVSVSAKDITHITTRFCELNVHTHENIHSLNLSLIKNAKTRWEIKDMIREMAGSEER